MKRLKEKDGSTIVSVMVAFAVLLMAFAMFYTSVSFSMNMISSASRIRQNIENSMEVYYTNSGTPTKQTLSVQLISTDGSSGSIPLPLVKGSYDTGYLDLTYFVTRETGVGYKGAKIIMDNLFKDASEFERIYGANNYSGTNYNEYIKLKNNNQFPPITESERIAAESALKDLSGKNTKLPEDMTWHANTTKEKKDKGYYLIANATPGQMWKANLIYIDGHMYVSTVLTKNGTESEGVNTASFTGYTVQELTAALNGSNPSITVNINKVDKPLNEVFKMIY